MRCADHIVGVGELGDDVGDGDAGDPVPGRAGVDGATLHGSGGASRLAKGAAGAAAGEDAEPDGTISAVWRRTSTCRSICTHCRLCSKRSRSSPDAACRAVSRRLASVSFCASARDSSSSSALLACASGLAAGPTGRCWTPSCGETARGASRGRGTADRDRPRSRSADAPAALVGGADGRPCPTSNDACARSSAALCSSYSSGSSRPSSSSVLRVLSFDTRLVEDASSAATDIGGSLTDRCLCCGTLASPSAASALAAASASDAPTALRGRSSRCSASARPRPASHSCGSTARRPVCLPETTRSTAAKIGRGTKVGRLYGTNESTPRSHCCGC